MTNQEIYTLWCARQESRRLPKPEYPCEAYSDETIEQWKSILFPNKIEVASGEVRMLKEKFTRFFEDSDGQLYGLIPGCYVYVGLLKITGETKCCYKGYIARCSHECWKQLKLKEVSNK